MTGPCLRRSSRPGVVLLDRVVAVICVSFLSPYPRPLFHFGRGMTNGQSSPPSSTLGEGGKGDEGAHIHQFQGYGLWETGCSAPSAYREKRKGLSASLVSPTRRLATSFPTPSILKP